MNYSEMEKKLAGTLERTRFEHSLGVCAEAERMAELFGADKNKARIAGLLHDCAKGLSAEQESDMCLKYGYEPDRMTLMCHPVLHAPLGAIAARAEYGVSDEEILDAIRYHTVARARMTLLDKIIYVADMTEPGRCFEGVTLLRRLAREDIDDAFFEALKQSLTHNIKKENIIHPNTLDAWNDQLITKKESEL